MRRSVGTREARMGGGDPCGRPSRSCVRIVPLFPRHTVSEVTTHKKGDCKGTSLPIHRRNEKGDRKGPHPTTLELLKRKATARVPARPHHPPPPLLRLRIGSSGRP